MADLESVTVAIRAAINEADLVQAIPSASSMILTLVLADGTSLTFAQADAVDIGDFVGEFVHQRCLEVVNGNWRVHFRPDADGSRDEIVVEYGRTFDGPLTHITSPYTATVAKGGAVLATLTIPVHWWQGRWRWQSAPRPVVRPPSVLYQRRWIPNFGTAGLYGLPQPTQPLCVYPGPFTKMAGIDPVMGVAGDHPQIGYLTEHAADYMVRPCDATLTTLRSEGEWVASACVHMRNDDGSLLDLTTGVNYVGYKGTILQPQNPPHGTDGFIFPEVSHTYPCATAAWLLTEDPYMLEELQFMTNWVILQYNWTKRYGVIPYGQSRAYAWGLRDLFTCAATTPASAPKWIGSKNYWNKLLAVNLTYSMQFVNASARVHSYFKAWTRSDMVDGWMSAWLTAAVGMGVQMGFAEWRPVFDWSVDMQIQMSNGTSGWNRQVPAPYEYFPCKRAASFASLQDASSDAWTCADWADAWQYFASGSTQLNADGTPVLKADGTVQNRTGWGDTSTWDDHSFYQFKSDGTMALSPNAVYQQHLRSALAMAVKLGTQGAQACYDYVHTECAATNARTNHNGQARFSVDP